MRADRHGAGIEHLAERRSDLGGALFGPLAEAVSVWRGGWTYSDPDLFGVPVWLPVGWGLACLILKRLSETVREIIANRRQAI